MACICDAVTQTMSIVRLLGFDLDLLFAGGRTICFEIVVSEVFYEQEPKYNNILDVVQLHSRDFGTLAEMY